MPKSSHLIQKELDHQRQQLINDFIAEKQAYTFFQQYSQLLAKTLTSIWEELNIGSHLCLCAIGGFGRQETYPYSDIDIAIVAQHDLSAQDEQKISQFILTLWDINLSPAPKVGSIQQLCQLAQEDLSSDTAFLEAQLICGKQSVFTQFTQELTTQRDIAAFIDGKLIEYQQRHTKSQGVANQLEPNLKTCPGGLRDFHTMLWLTKVQGLDFDILSLIKNKIITHKEAHLLLQSHQFLAILRIALHIYADHAEDHLLFDYQIKLADLLGQQHLSSQEKIEYLMKKVYRATKLVKQLDGILLPMLKGRIFSNVEHNRFHIDQNYYQIGRLIAAYDKTIFHKDSTQIFYLVELFQTHKDIIGIAPKTLRAWWSASHQINQSFRDNPINQHRFIQFFKHGTGLTHLLRLLNLYGLLGKYLPNFGRIIGLLQYDLFHIYPVDDHILAVVRNVRRLAIKEHNHELPLASSLMEQFEPKYILYLAALLHDIAKGRHGDHALLGAEDAHQFAQQHQLNDNDTELLVWLIKHHLLLSMTAQKEDIHDNQVIARFCKTVNNTQKLIALYILTVADVRGTNPKIWNTWKASIFESLFHRAFHYLQGNQEYLHNEIQHNMQQTAVYLQSLKIQDKQIKEIYQQLGDNYFIRHTLSEIEWHLSYISTDMQEAVFALREGATQSILELMVYMANAPRLFAQICQIISHLPINIESAKAYITQHNFILDTFILTFPQNFTPADQQRICQLLSKKLKQFLQQPQTQNSISPPILPRNSRALHLPIIPTVSLVEEEGAEADYYMLYIISVNKRGLLANIASVLSDMNISIRYANITTLDERVEDSFLVHSPKLSNTNFQLALKHALLDKIK